MPWLHVIYERKKNIWGFSIKAIIFLCLQCNLYYLHVSIVFNVTPYTLLSLKQLHLASLKIVSNITLRLH
jgi:hypothetical protein